MGPSALGSQATALGERGQRRAESGLPRGRSVKAPSRPGRLLGARLAGHPGQRAFCFHGQPGALSAALSLCDEPGALRRVCSVIPLTGFAEGVCLEQGGQHDLVLLSVCLAARSP